MIKKRTIGRIDPPSVKKLGKPGKRVLVQKVDSDFLEFFEKGEWEALLEDVEIPGMDNPSWDRKAAWLYWQGLQ